ncbi:MULTISPECIES: Ig-like domain-containing protein [Mesorhizobium]|nr:MULTISPECIES: Ig-like domain-containing protein [Mesorhizobium]
MPRTSRMLSIFVVLCVPILGAAAVFIDHRPHTVAIFPKPSSEVATLKNIRVAFDRPLAAEQVRVTIEGKAGDAAPFAIKGSVHVQTGNTINFAADQTLAPANYHVTIHAEDKQLADWRFTVADTPRNDESGAPILIVGGDASDLNPYYTEILSAEGFTGFKTASKSEFAKLDLAGIQSIIVSGDLDNSGSARLKEWVENGGNLVAVMPTGALADLAGVKALSVINGEGYFQIDTGSAPGKGLVSQPIQFHGDAKRFAANDDARVFATLISGPDKSTSPAATIRTVGANGGQVAALAFNLAKSVVFTRQGNPAWAGQDRDGMAPVRPNDLFFGNSKTDPQPDYLDVNNAQIPQADETMRLLTNVLEYMQRDASPIPRFWYFPKDYKAALVMAADDHGTKDGTRNFFEMLDLASPAGCDMTQWTCARATSFIYPDSGLSNSDAEFYNSIGFDTGAHVTTNCEDWTRESLDNSIAAYLSFFQVRFPELPTQRGSRLHCIAWSDYTTQAEVERSWDIRFDMNYYHWPKDWLKNKSGFMTGSGLPMRFSKTDGEIIDVYQQETHLVDEVFVDNLPAVEELFAKAFGPEGFYGAFGTHFDFNNDFAPKMIELAHKWQVPMISAAQLLDWENARSHSQISDLQWGVQTLQFKMQAAPATGGALTTMVPMRTNDMVLAAISLDGKPVEFKTAEIKGVQYALFPSANGTYSIRYNSSFSADETGSVSPL